MKCMSSPCHPTQVCVSYQRAVGFQPSPGALGAVAAAAAARAATLAQWRAGVRSFKAALSESRCAVAAPLLGRDAAAALLVEQPVAQVGPSVATQSMLTSTLGNERFSTHVAQNIPSEWPLDGQAR